MIKYVFIGYWVGFATRFYLFFSWYVIVKPKRFIFVSFVLVKGWKKSENISVHFFLAWLGSSHSVISNFINIL